MIRVWLLVVLSCCWILAGEAAPAQTAAAKARIEYATRLAKTPDDQLDRRVELARWARGKGLATESDSLLEAVIAAKVDHAGARKALGYEKIGNDWLRGEPLWQTKKWVRYLGRWMPPAERRKLIARRDGMRQELKSRSGWDKAWESKTAHFAIKSNCQVRVVEDILTAMEQYHTVASRMFQLTGNQARIPVEVYADQDEFLKASAASGMGAAENVLGYYVPGKDLIRAYFAGSVDETLGTLFHETTHLIVNRFAKREVPTWSNEGLAVYFEDAERLEDRVDPNAIPWTRLWHLHDMMEAKPVDLEGTVACPHAGYTVEFYPRGWALTHFLLNGPYRKNYENYLGLLRKGGDMGNAALFLKGIGKKPGDLQAEWEKHVKALEPKTADELAGAARAALGSYLDPQRAEDYAERAVVLAPDAWRCHAALGTVRLALARLSGDAALASGAVESFDRAVELAGADLASIKARVKKGQSLSVWTGLLAGRMFALHAAGDGEGAAAAASDLLEVDAANAYAYGMLAILGAGDAQDGGDAQAFIETAQDIGNDHVVRWCAARVAFATGKADQGTKLLAEAAKLDRLGLGRAWYPREAKRLAAPAQ